jgi:hypothetical protein
MRQKLYIGEEKKMSSFPNNQSALNNKALIASLNSKFFSFNYALFFFVLHSLDTAVQRCCSFSDLLCLLSSNLVGLIYSRLDDLLLLGAQRFGQILVELGLLLLKNCQMLVICRSGTYTLG